MIIKRIQAVVKLEAHRKPEEIVQLYLDLIPQLQQEMTDIIQEGFITPHAQEQLKQRADLMASIGARISKLSSKFTTTRAQTSSIQALQEFQSVRTPYDDRINALRSEIHQLRSMLQSRNAQKAMALDQVKQIYNAAMHRQQQMDRLVDQRMQYLDGVASHVVSFPLPKLPETFTKRDVITLALRVLNPADPSFSPWEKNKELAAVISKQRNQFGRLSDRAALGTTKEAERLVGNQCHLFKQTCEQLVVSLTPSLKAGLVPASIRQTLDVEQHRSIRVGVTKVISHHMYTAVFETAKQVCAIACRDSDTVFNEAASYFRPQLLTDPATAPVACPLLELIGLEPEISPWNGVYFPRTMQLFAGLINMDSNPHLGMRTLMEMTRCCQDEAEAAILEGNALLEELGEMPGDVPVFTADKFNQIFMILVCQEPRLTAPFALGLLMESFATEEDYTDINVCVGLAAFSQGLLNIKQLYLERDSREGM
eukprot:gnl/Dysnectes_brevis/1739_a1983_1760.p1 GENE.gnl/Dysnectes_brevis/1739_a1983_1760~~gnl/Dysnectes_brevis/1739_a1983_1760.p1  ORF type:complete len:482 (+),score=142.05 gnl/Dysnectes_brevis/1739_a1983_1760:1796-3241(+)